MKAILPPPLDILYQDEHFIAVDKPAGHLVHPAEHPQEDDLVTMKILRDQIGKRVYPIHRLDRPTRGVLIMGTDRECAKLLHKQFEQHQITKTYWAIVHPAPKFSHWTENSSLQKTESHPWVTAQTTFKLLNKTTLKNTPLALIECIPHTGRFHQIRKHLLKNGTPILGDYKYAGIKLSEKLSNLFNLEQKMQLLAKSLKLEHPITKEEILINIKLPQTIENTKDMTIKLFKNLHSA